ncbi:MAG: hypothetical protein Aurels2KO_22960 [Aureliella sp.]
MDDGIVPATAPKKPRFIVGIGASAGGLEAIESLFDGLPNDLGMAYVIVQHLSPDFRSLMDELLSRWTSMPIFQVTDGLDIAANCIYLLPPGKEIAISDSRLILKDKEPGEGLTFPIDHFLRSLAHDAGERAIGIILSGTGSDGSRGVSDIHDAGGLVIVQTEESAKFNGMPRSSIDSGLADLVLSPSQIRDALIRYHDLPHAVDLAGALSPPEVDEIGLKRVFLLIRDKFGLDLNQYKTNTIIRRTERRMLLCKRQHIDEYAALVESSPEELQRLYGDLLIGVTRFFRDAKAFEELEKVAAGLIETAREGSEIRVWTAGCSTGQEAYGIAIILDELVAAQTKQLNIKIFATDMDAGSLEVAQSGTYSTDEIANIGQERLEKYFTVSDDSITVAARIRQMIVFAQHNLLRDAPFTKLDLIVCRNLMIYMVPKAQKKILSLFHFGLRRRGILFLGPSETTSEIAEEFDVIESHWRLFRKRRDIRLTPEFREDIATRSSLRPSGLPNLDSNSIATSDKLMMSTYDAVLERIMPPAFLVREDGTLLHTFGDAGQFLKPETGRHTSKIGERVVNELKAAVSTGLRKALRDNSRTKFGRVHIPRDGEHALSLDVTAIPIDDPALGLRTILIQLDNQVLIEPAEESDSENQRRTSEFPNDQIESLETELAIVKQSLHSTIQELETSNEELQATNEEMLASNEELQSTNEELHSVNEELYTVNAEHQNKITQLSEVTRDMDNLLHSTEVHTIFLDRDLLIRKFTPRVAETFSLIPQDIGRRIDSFKSSIECQNLPQKLQKVIDTSEPYEEEVCDRSGTWFLMRLLPYRSTLNTRKETIGGALLTLVDITKLRETSQALEDSVRKRDQFLAMLSHELRNPLGTIVNATHLAGKADLPAPVGDSVAVIHRQSQHMATLLDDLLDVARVSQGKIQIQRHPFDLRRAINGAIESVSTRCQARNQNLIADIPDEPVWVEGSEPRLLQVVSNLLTNASKYSRPTETITISLACKDNRANVSVVDNGVGISAEHQERIFEMFVQSDRTIDRADGGLGIGLTLVRALVELHDGQVTVTSDGIDKGSRFEVSLPIYEGEVTLDAEAEAESGRRPNSRRIVLVEDNIEATKMLAFLLEDAGCQVSIAHDGKEGLDLIRSTRPATAIIDIGLPELSGYEVAKMIRQDKELNSMFLIALTGYGQSSDREEALAAGFDEHVVKPADPDLLARLAGGHM